MTKGDFLALRKGDRVHWVGYAPPLTGVVTLRVRSRVLVQWSDGEPCTYHLSDRAYLERARPAAAERTR